MTKQASKIETALAEWPEFDPPPERSLTDLEAELLAALKALVDGRPIIEPPKIAAVAHRNWELFQQARAVIAKAEGSKP